MKVLSCLLIYLLYGCEQANDLQQAMRSVSCRSYLVVLCDRAYFLKDLICSYLIHMEPLQSAFHTAYCAQMVRGYDTIDRIEKTIDKSSLC